MAAARKLTRRVGRERAGRFLAEGAQAVGAALDRRGATVYELFATPAAAGRHPALLADAERSGVRVTLATERALAGLSETVAPQGLVAVCGLLDVPLRAALDGDPRLVVVLVGTGDPGNAGTVIRVADAAGADAVVLAGDAVDPHNGKCVRASAGSVFHLPLARERDVGAVVAGCRGAGLRLLAADGAGELDLDDAELSGPAAWVFGSEAHGLLPELAAACDERVRVPIFGRAESLNLASAAAVCLYSSAQAQRTRSEAGQPGPAGG